MSSKEWVHQPKHVFTNDGPSVIGFLRTEGDANEVFSRKQQTDQIRAWAASRGFREPVILPTAQREALTRTVEPGSILIVPRISSLLRRPSDLDDLLKWIFENRVRVEIIELGGDASSQLTLIKKISDAYLPLERQVAEMRQQMKDQADTTDEIINEVLHNGLQQLSRKFIGIREDLQKIKQDAIHAVTDPVAATTS